MKPLRAFIYSCSQEGNWSVNVFRDLETLEAELKIGAEFDRLCLFLHIGFWRPETTEVSQLHEGWKSRVLISQTAIQALPVAPKVSAKPVLHLGSLPVHVCLSGFGYEIYDPTLVVKAEAEIQQSPPKQPASMKSTAELIAVHRKGVGIKWVEWTAIQREDLASVFEQHGITNDEDFLEKERNISAPEVRHELALIRFRMLTGENPDPSDFIDKVHATPNWFLDLPLTHLNLTVRQMNVFSEHSLLTVQDLAALGTLGLFKLPNIGKKSVNELAEMLLEAFNNGQGIPQYVKDGVAPYSYFAKVPNISAVAPTKVQEAAAEPFSFDSFSDGIKSAVMGINLEHVGVWAARIGYKCQRHTLQQVAETIGVTRERVRQIEGKVVKLISKSTFWEYLSDRIANLLKDRESPLLVGGISAIDPWFDRDVDFEDPLKEICYTLLNKKYSVFKVRDVAVLTEISSDQWEDAVGNANSALEAIIGTDVTESQARSIIDGLLPSKGKELRNDLWHEVTLDAKWSGTSPNDKTLVGFGNDIETVILTVLSTSEVPLHISEISNGVRAYGLANHDENYIRNAAQKVAILFSRSTYGLAKHVTLSEEQMAIIRSEVESIVSEGEPTRQWHTSELFDQLEDRDLDFDGKLTKYLVNIALKESKELSYLGRMVWGVSEHWSNKATQRLDVRQAVISLLESEGKPMSFASIRERLTQDRGVGTNFQIHPAPPLIRIGPSLFGLDYRDINYEETHPLVDKLKDALRARNSGLHISEIPAALGLSGEDNELLVAKILIVGQRHGLKQDKAQHIFLEEWQASRRYSVTAAFQQAIAEAGQNGVSSNQIWKRICDLTGRHVSQNSISHMLRDQNYKWDETRGLWFENLDQDDEE